MTKAKSEMGNNDSHTRNFKYHLKSQDPENSIIFNFRHWKAYNLLIRIMLRPEKETLRSKLGGIARSLSVRKGSRRGSGQPIVPLESRPSKTTIPPMAFPDLNESMTTPEDSNVSEAPDFTCRRLSIKFFDDVSDRKYKVFRVVMVKDDFIFTFKDTSRRSHF